MSQSSDPQSLLSEFKNELQELNNKVDIQNHKAKYLGKKGLLSEVLKGLKDLSETDRRELGQKINGFKDEMEELTRDKIAAIERQEIDQQLNSPAHWIDITERASSLDLGLSASGGLHPVTTIQREIEDIFISMGFEVLDGPYVEDDYHNFEALNIPKTHPARDMQDTFWFQDGIHLLRTHTSTIQVRGMATRKPPFQFVGPGKVFRCERTDASHEMCFHQLEGMMVGEGISVSNLIYFMKTLLGEIFQKSVEVRLRPGFFPFVEPGFELDIKCLICGGPGCSVCKRQGWVELLPCGMVHPNVLKHGGIDPTIYTGFAFGLGLDRLVMMKYGIDDIRHLHGGDLKFISQFSAF
jgi:phenylalanyl-tRNA synthetase alpha chain